jgi:Tfp pilus assembly protein PilE
MKNNKGVTLTILVVTIIVLLILAGIILGIGTSMIKNAEIQSLNTNLLLIQARVEIISEMNSFNGTPLKGTQVTATETTASALLTTVGITTEQDKYYIWNQTILNEEHLSRIELKQNEYYLVNYETSEVINSIGVERDGIRYYKLSDVKALKIED